MLNQDLLETLFGGYIPIYTVCIFAPEQHFHKLFNTVCMLSHNSILLFNFIFREIKKSDQSARQSNI